MQNPVQAIAYDDRYDLTRAAAAAWLPGRLTYVLHFLLPLGRHDEDAWGAIDAMADLIRELRPIPWSSYRDEGLMQLPVMKQGVAPIQSSAGPSYQRCREQEAFLSAVLHHGAVGDSILYSLIDGV